jgi:hypothetical protein
MAENKQLVKRGRKIPEPTPDKPVFDRRPVYKISTNWGDEDTYAIKQYYWNCAVCGKEFVARREAKHCALFHCPKCKVGSLVWAGEGPSSQLWKCECGYYTHHNPEFGRLLEKDEIDANEAQEAADQGYIDYTKHETPEADP